jgi:hypothetical protein
MEREYHGQGSRIGWTDGQHVYLDPDASYKVAQSMATNGEGIPIAANTLRKRLKERGYLIVEGKRETLTVRRVLDGAQRKALCFPMSVFGHYAHELPDNPDNPDNGCGADGPEGDLVSAEVSGFAPEHWLEPDTAT